MHFESKWWSLELPPDFRGELKPGLLSILHPEISGFVEFECIQKDSGAPNDNDLLGHAGANASKCAIGDFCGFYSEDAHTQRWALRQRRNRKLILIRHREHQGKLVEERLIRLLIGAIKLK